MTDTNDFSFTSGDVKELTNALCEIAVNLPKEQWGLLLSIFAAAAGGFEISQNRKQGTFSGVKVRVDDGVIDDPEGKTADELCAQLRGAYMPGRPATRRVDHVGMITPPQGAGGHH